MWSTHSILLVVHTLTFQTIHSTMGLLERARTELIGDDDSTPADTDGPTVFCRSAFSERIEGGP